MAISIPPEDRLPHGPVRDLVQAIHELYDEAGQPAARRIARSIFDRRGLESVSHESVSALLRGDSLLSWAKVESVVQVLISMSAANKDRDVAATLAHINSLWLGAKAADRQASSVLTAPQELPLADAEVLPASPGLAVPAYDADYLGDGPQADLIGIDAEVSAFAHLIASKQLGPPLAVGLFGEWGSGKSFFMRALRTRVDELTRRARQDGNHPVIHRRIAQIEFNAWHYVEGNLWASLVAHIFDNLRTSRDERASALQRRRARVAAELASTQEIHERTATRLSHLAEQIDQTEQTLVELREEREKKLDELKGLRLRAVAAAITIPEPDARRIQDSLSELGITAVGDRADELVTAVGRARALVRRGGATAALTLRRGWRWTLLLVAAVLAGPVAGLLLGLLDLSAVTQAAGAVAAFLAVAVTVLNKGAGWAVRLLDRLDEADRSLRQRLTVATQEHATQIAEMEGELEDLRVEEQALRESQLEAEKSVVRIKEELAALNPARMLSDFVNERVDADDYRKLLGLTALVRRDFEQLSRLVEDHNTSGEDTGHGLDFNRIVLYIDDLDRCPAKRVVEVLHAIHLLLSFPIFVVVVAVDGRWLSRSLNLQHADMLGADGPDVSGNPSATAQDYLEKIFQIPFWVPRLGTVARRRLIAGLAKGNGGPAEPQVQGTASPGTGEPTTALPESPDLDGDDGTDVTLLSERLEIDADDLAAIDTITPLLGDSPRAVKRFLNVFRLVKAIALWNDRPIDGAVDRHRALLLLAVVTELPQLAAVLLPALSPTAEETLSGVLTGTRGQTTDSTVIQDLDRLENWLATTAVPDGTLEPAGLAKWAPTVARYSFHAPKSA